MEKQDIVYKTSKDKKNSTTVSGTTRTIQQYQGTARHYLRISQHRLFSIDIRI
jgi:hypothetical protein